MRIICSACGDAQKKTPAEMVKLGWRTCGSAAYCPNCIQSWEKRNSHEYDNEFISLTKFERMALK